MLEQSTIYNSNLADFVFELIYFALYFCQREFNQKISVLLHFLENSTLKYRFFPTISSPVRHASSSPFFFSKWFFKKNFGVSFVLKGERGKRERERERFNTHIRNISLYIYIYTKLFLENNNTFLLKRKINGRKMHTDLRFDDGVEVPHRHVKRYDGQMVFVGDEQTAHLELGNYLGGGAAGVVYESVNLETYVAFENINHIPQ